MARRSPRAWNLNRDGARGTPRCVRIRSNIFRQRSAPAPLHQTRPRGLRRKRATTATGAPRGGPENGGITPSRYVARRGRANSAQAIGLTRVRRSPAGWRLRCAPAAKGGHAAADAGPWAGTRRAVWLARTLLARFLAGAARGNLVGLHVSGIRCASGSTAPTRHEHETHCRGSGAASCWVYRCREPATTLPGVLEPRETAWQRFLVLRPAVRDRRTARPRRAGWTALAGSRP